MKYTAPKVRLSRALAAFDNDQKALAAYLGITQNAVINWRKAKLKYLPEMRALQIAQAMPELVENKAA